MNAESICALFLAIAIFGYLLVALLFAERI